jgi:tripartite-type tricarboxylate transporter receptor subunit TctC
MCRAGSRQVLSCFAVALLTGAMPITYAAQPAYPERPIRLVLSFGAPGGTPDTIARTAAPKLSEMYGRQVVVDPRSGAGGVLGTEIGARAAPDGYTWVIVSPAHAINPALRKLPYDSVKDFTPVTQLVENPNILAVYPPLGVRSVKELIAMAKAKPGALSYASAGVGSSQHLSGELFNTMAGVKTVHVPYKGGAAAVTDLVAGRVQFTFGAGTSLPHIKAGRLIALGVTTAKRNSQMPDVPTIAESGLPGYEAGVWYGLLMPAGVSAQIVNKVHRDWITVLNMPDVRKILESITADVITSPSPRDFREFLARETTKWAEVVKTSGAKPD